MCTAGSRISDNTVRLSPPCLHYPILLSSVEAPVLERLSTHPGHLQPIISTTTEKRVSLPQSSELGTESPWLYLSQMAAPDPIAVVRTRHGSQSRTTCAARGYGREAALPGACSHHCQRQGTVLLDQQNNCPLQVANLFTGQVTRAMHSENKQMSILSK